MIKSIEIFLVFIKILCFMNFVLILYTFSTNNSQDGQPSTSSSQLVSILISFIYYGFGFLVTYRYYQTGLLAVCNN